LKEPRKRPVFLSADWNNLLFANYTIDPEILTPLVPRGTELDVHNGSCYISLVAFQFLNTKVFGIPAISMRNFDEINLRFYVKRPLRDGNDQSGVVFIKEIVPSRLIAWTARTFYGENYIAMEMSHEITNGRSDRDLKLTYRCEEKESSNKFLAVVSPGSEMGEDEGLGSYITEHYWGYSSPAQEKTIEYEVKHPKWPINKVTEYSIDFDFEGLYGTPYRSLSESEPASVLYCRGSDVTVHLGSKITR
tara:strand:+ start:1405 stop:2148 length:744 start_codon:yes stop_codon:yes gene_type:complete